MTATKNAPGGSPPTTGFFTPRRGNPRRRSPAMVSIGVILVVLGALGAWRFVGVAAAGTHPYIAVFKPVPIGATITADDLQVVKITSAAGLNPIPADEAHEVVGKHAKVQLVPGTLLTPDELTGAGSPANGQALVGLQLKPNRRPSRTLRPGEKVTLIETPDPSATNVDPSSAPTWPATVLDVQRPPMTGHRSWTSSSTPSNVSPIATMGNAGRIVAVLVPGS